MEFRVLGPLQAIAGPAEVVLARRERILLALLLLHPNQPVSVERISEAIWGDQQPRKAAGQVHGTVYRLRKQLTIVGIPEAVILTDPAGYRTQIDPEALDLIRFRQLRDQARTTATGGGPEQAAAQYRAGLDLWRGSALAGIDSDLLRQAAAALDEEHLQAWQECLETELTLGQAGELVAELTDLVGQHPHREGLHRLLMLALYRAGRQADALAAYRHVRQLLRDDLGIEPGPELQRLHQAILNRDPELNADRRQPKPAPTTTATSAIPRELPADVPGFTGRADALRALEEMLAAVSDKAPAPVVISAIAGTAGVGKTALAVHWTHRVAHRFPDGQLYLNLRGYATEAPVRPIEALSALLRSLGTPPEQIPTDEAQAAALYRTKLADRRMIIVLDNVRTVDQVRPLLPGSSGCFVLVTSRDRLTGLVAHDGAKRITLDVLSADEAQALLASLLGPERVRAESQAITDLAQTCSYLPLALRIATAHIVDHPGRTISEYVSDLTTGNRIATLQVDGDDESAVRVAFEVSYIGMPAETQQTFRLLGLVPGPDFTPETAAAIAATSKDDAVRHLRQLAAGHLVEEHASGRYAFHDLLRLYAAQLAAGSDSLAKRRAAIQGLADHYLTYAVAATRTLYPQTLRLSMPGEDRIPVQFDQPAAAWTWLEDERPNLVAAITYATDHGPRAFSPLLADCLRDYFWQSRHYTDWQTVATSGRIAADHEGDKRTQASAEYGLAALELATGRYGEAVACCTRALTLARRASWVDGQARAMAMLGTICQILGRLQEAADYYAQSLAMDQGIRRRRPTTVLSLGILYTAMGRLQDARDQCEQGLMLCRQLEWKPGEASALQLLGHSYYYLGRLDQAYDYLKRAVGLSREFVDPLNEAGALDGMAAVCRDSGRLNEAVERARASMEIIVETGVRQHQAEALNTLGSIQLRLKCPRQALDCHESAMDLACETQDQSPQINALLGSASAQQRLGGLDRANQLACQGLENARKGGYRVLEGKALTSLAEINLGQERLREATEYAYLALTNHQETGHRLGMAQTLVVLGRITNATGQREATRRHWREALALFADIGAEAPEDIHTAIGQALIAGDGGATAPEPAGPD